MHQNFQLAWAQSQLKSLEASLHQSESLKDELLVQYRENPVNETVYWNSCMIDTVLMTSESTIT